MDHVVKLEFEYFGADRMRLYSSVFQDGPWYPNDTDANRLDADLLSIRRVRVTLCGYRLLAPPCVSSLGCF